MVQNQPVNPSSADPRPISSSYELAAVSGRVKYAATTDTSNAAAATSATHAKTRRTVPRVTSRTPQAASSTRLIADASG